MNARPRDDSSLFAQRHRMVIDQLRRRGIRDERVLAAMEAVPRHRFLPPALHDVAYVDRPLPIGEGQTISQPLIVALMTQALAPHDGDRVLELGTGSGYQAAVLAELGCEVWTVERSPRLAADAMQRLQRLGYDRVRCVCGDGTLGRPDAAPFSGILAAGSLPSVPTALLDQLRPGGCLVAPVGRIDCQELLRITYDEGRIERESLGPCRFVPLIGRFGWPESFDRNWWSDPPGDG